MTAGVYSDRLMLTRSAIPQHWKNSLAEVDANVAHVKDLLRQHGDGGGRFRAFGGESPLANPPRIEHTPVTTAAPGVDLRISAKVSSSDPLRRVILHYRPVNQAVAWKEIDLRPTGDGLFEATIPASDITPAWDLMYLPRGTGPRRRHALAIVGNRAALRGSDTEAGSAAGCARQSELQMIE